MHCIRVVFLNLFLMLWLFSQKLISSPHILVEVDMQTKKKTSRRNARNASQDRSSPKVSRSQRKVSENGRAAEKKVTDLITSSVRKNKSCKCHWLSDRSVQFFKIIYINFFFLMSNLSFNLFAMISAIHD